MRLRAFLSRGISRPPLQRAGPSSALLAAVPRDFAARRNVRRSGRCRRGRNARQRSTWAPATAAVHADAALDATSHGGDVAPPIGLSTTFDDGADHVYSRISAPTRQRCEAVLAALEGGEGARAVLFASGNAATHAVLASLAARARERADAARRHRRHRLPRHARRGRGPRPGRRGGWRGRRSGRGRRRLAREPAEPGPARAGRRGGLRRTR